MSKKYFEEDVIVILQNLAEKLGRTPRQMDMDLEENVPRVPTICRIFGTFNNAIIAAGLEPNKIPNMAKKPQPEKTGRRSESKLSKEEIIELLKLKAKEMDGTPTWLDISLDQRFPSPGTCIRIFGGTTYNELIAAAGLKPHKYRSRSCEKAPI